MTPTFRAGVGHAAQTYPKATAVVSRLKACGAANIRESAHFRIQLRVVISRVVGSLGAARCRSPCRRDVPVVAFGRVTIACGFMPSLPRTHFGSRSTSPYHAVNTEVKYCRNSSRERAIWLVIASSPPFDDTAGELERRNRRSFTSPCRVFSAQDPANRLESRISATRNGSVWGSSSLLDESKPQVRAVRQDTETILTVGFFVTGKVILLILR